jgi:SAM-dependent methyltransferase
MVDFEHIASLLTKWQLQKQDGFSQQITRFLFDRGDVLQAAHWLTRQDDLAVYDPERLLQINGLLPKPYLNVGGGPTFAYPFWENLDSAKSPLNPKPFVFGPDIDFPFKAESFDLVYSSHTLEHLDDATVQKILTEARRVLRPGAPLLIKIPDFDAALEAVRVNDISFFSDERWNFPAITPTFANRGVNDGLPARSAYVFCGFWNSSFGDLFGNYDNRAAGAYNGPVANGDADLLALMRVGSPHEIAATMTARVRQMESDFTFNHQNAWSADEMKAVLSDAGFKIFSTDKGRIVERFGFVPKIAAMFDISAFYLAT